MTDRLTVQVAGSDLATMTVIAAGLSAEPGLEVTGLWNGGDRPSADVVVALDLPPDQLAAADGGARIGVVALGPRDDRAAMLTAIESGARAYLDREAAHGRIAQTVRDVAAGRAVIEPALMGALLRYVVDRRRRESAELQRLEVLTRREREVFELAAAGMDKHAIADELTISPETARTHVERVLVKLGVHSKVELAAIAARCGLLRGSREGA